MVRYLKIGTPIVILSLFILTFFGMFTEAKAVEIPKPRGEIRVVESWRLDITVLGHNVLQNLFDYVLDKNGLAPSLAVSREQVDDATTLKVKLRQGVIFNNVEQRCWEGLLKRSALYCLYGLSSMDGSKIIFFSTSKTSGDFV